MLQPADGTKHTVEQLCRCQQACALRGERFDLCLTRDWLSPLHVLVHGQLCQWLCSPLAARRQPPSMSREGHSLSPDQPSPACAPSPCLLHGVLLRCCVALPALGVECALAAAEARVRRGCMCGTGAGQEARMPARNTVLCGALARCLAHQSTPAWHCLALAHVCYRALAGRRGRAGGTDPGTCMRGTAAGQRAGVPAQNEAQRDAPCAPPPWMGPQLTILSQSDLPVGVYTRKCITIRATGARILCIQEM